MSDSTRKWPAEVFLALLRFMFVSVAIVLFLICLSGTTYAQLTTENPKSNAFGLEGVIKSPPPTQGARIIAPSGGQAYSEPLITVSGTCPKGLLVEILSNGVMVGSTFCEDGSFSLQISLFFGQNDLTARVLDSFGQQGPPSNTVSVTFNAGGFTEIGSGITLTSAYSRRSADPGSTLLWPLQLSGGQGPYAFSIDWGDGSQPDLKSQPTAGIINISHVYKAAGIYKVTIRVTDINGVTGFLQVIAVANGDAEATIKTGEEPETRTIVRTNVIWIPAAIAVALLLPAYWLGRRSEMHALRRKLERDARLVRKLDRK